MKAVDVKKDGLYSAKITKRVVTVKITGKHKSGGWHALNTVTGKKIHIKTAERLIEPVIQKNYEGHSKDDINVSCPEKLVTDKSCIPEKKLSLIGAATQILQNAKEPMSCKEIVEHALAHELWRPAKGGKTPANTLYASILLEIKKKGENSCERL